MLTDRVTMANKRELPPHSTELEQAVLGAIIDRGVIANGLLKPEYFYQKKHRVLARAVLKLAQQGKPTDMPNVVQFLNEMGELENVGGAYFISGLPEFGSIRVDHDAQKLKELAIKRAIREKAIKLAQSDWKRPLEEIRRELDFVSVALKDGISKETNLQFITPPEIGETTPLEWVVPGIAVRGAITELDGKIKAAGKTTFLTFLSQAVILGKPFLDQPTRQSSVVYLTEQGLASFKAALGRANLMDSGDLFFLSYPEAAGTPWADVVSEAAMKCVQAGAGLLIVDTLGQWARLGGESENQAGEALRAMHPLQIAASQHNLAVIVARHERKSGGEIEDAARGSSAFAGIVDIILRLKRSRGNAENVRVLESLSRFEDTPSLAIRLDDSGFILLGSEKNALIESVCQEILEALPRAPEIAFTRKELQESIGAKPDTIRRALERLEENGQITKSGEGKKNDPFRYSVSFEINQDVQQKSETKIIPDDNHQEKDSFEIPI